jgi:hypothetical protein
MRSRFVLGVVAGALALCPCQWLQFWGGWILNVPAWVPEAWRFALLEQQVLGVIRDRLLTPARMERFKKGLLAERGRKAQPAVSNADRIAALDKKIANYAAAIGEGLLSPELRQRMAEAERERADVKAAPATPARANVEKAMTDAFKVYRELVDDIAGEAAEQGQAVMARLFDTIPVDRQGRATVTLDLENMLSFTNAALPRGLVGSGGRI